MPEAAVLVFVWKAFADFKNTIFKDMPVKFEDIKIYKQIIVESEDDIRLEIAVQTGCNKFEVFFSTIEINKWVQVKRENIILYFNHFLYIFYFLMFVVSCVIISDNL